MIMAIHFFYLCSLGLLKYRKWTILKSPGNSDTVVYFYRCYGFGSRFFIIMFKMYMRAFFNSMAKKRLQLFFRKENHMNSEESDAVIPIIDPNIRHKRRTNVYSFVSVLVVQFHLLINKRGTGKTKNCRRLNTHFAMLCYSRH